MQGIISLDLLHGLCVVAALVALVACLFLRNLSLRQPSPNLEKH